MSIPMEPQIIIAQRIARELKAGMLVNLGIGIPTAIANYIPEGLHVFFQSENGLIGTGAPPGAMVTGTAGLVTLNSKGEVAKGSPLPSRPFEVVKLTMFKGQIPELPAVICRSV